MSRLIDADKVRTIIVDEMWNVDDLPHDEQQAVIKACYSIWERIEKRALIGDAIPIEWIMWVWRRNQSYDTQEDAWMRLGVLKMLRDWEKENEID